MDGSDTEKVIQNLLGLEGNIISAEKRLETEENGYNYYLYNKDIQGSTTSILDETGKGELSYEYDEFGETTIHGGSGLANEICYTGGIYDESTGLYYLNARYYDPTTGRFLTEDTYRGESGDIADWHLYAYCANDPINYVDPSGHMKKHWYNSVKWVARFIDAAIRIYTGISAAKSMKVLIKMNKKRLSVFTRRVLIRKLQKNIAKTFISSALDLAMILTGSSIGTLIAKGLDYADGWWGYRRNNGYILN